MLTFKELNRLGELKSGPMEASMKVNGKMDKPVVKVDSGMLMETHMKVRG